MSAFFLVEIESIRDPEQYQEYVKRVAPIIARYGGEYVIRSDRVTAVSGSLNAKRVILIRFENKEDISTCFHSSEYREIAHLREQSTESKAMIIET
jgi:uncharacterized protein (DUF1330 family)